MPMLIAFRKAHPFCFLAMLLLLAACSASIVPDSMVNHRTPLTERTGLSSDTLPPVFPAEKVLRTPDHFFSGLADFPYPPNYAEVPLRESDPLPLRLHYIDVGPRDGRVLLLLHGQSQWAYAWRDLFPLLVAAGFRVVAPDMIGFGRSDKPLSPQAYSFDQHLYWLGHFIEGMAFSQPVTGVFFDWGGYLGLRLAAGNPDQFDRLVLSNTYLPRGMEENREFYRRWQTAVLAREVFPVSAMINEGVMRKLDRVEGQAYDAPYPDERYKVGLRRLTALLPIDETDPVALANQQAWDALGRFDRPVLTVFSRAFSQSVSLGPKPLINHIPGARQQTHVLADNAGYYLPDDIGAEMARLIIAFHQ